VTIFTLGFRLFFYSAANKLDYQLFQQAFPDSGWKSEEEKGGSWTPTVAQYASCRPIECAKQRMSICYAVACVLLLLFICKPTAPFL
jgi:hypothetical protein